MCSNLVPRCSGLRELASPKGLFAGPSANPSTRSLSPSSIILPGPLYPAATSSHGSAK